MPTVILDSEQKLRAPMRHKSAHLKPNPQQVLSSFYKKQGERSGPLTKRSSNANDGWFDKSTNNFQSELEGREIFPIRDETAAQYIRQPKVPNVIEEE